MSNAYIEISDKVLDAIANDEILEEEFGGVLMKCAIDDKDWPYVAGLILMEKSYKELSDKPELQNFIRKTCKAWGQDFSHSFWEELDKDQSRRLAARAVRKYNETKTGKPKT
jgi:hypothetical protein